MTTADTRPHCEATTEVIEAAQALVDAMETCHVCKCAVLVDESPVCENCSHDCEDHEPPDCAPLNVIHLRLKSALALERFSPRHSDREQIAQTLRETQERCAELEAALTNILQNVERNPHIPSPYRQTITILCAGVLAKGTR